MIGQPEKLGDSALDALLEIYSIIMPDKRMEYETAKDGYERLRLNFVALQKEKERRSK